MRHHLKLNQPTRIGFSYFEVPFIWAMVSHELTEHAARHGVRVILKGVRSTQSQVQAVESMIQAGVDALIVSPIMSEIPELLPLLESARSKGIAVSLIGGVHLNGAESFPLVRANTVAGQRELAELVFQRLGGKGKVAYIQGRQSKWNTLRVQAFREVLANYPDIQLVKDIVREASPTPQVTGTVAEMGRKWGLEIITEHPNVDAILVGQDDMALGLIDLLAEKGLTGKILVTGFDGLPAALKAIGQGTMFASIQLPVLDIAQGALDNIMALLRGETVPPLTLLPARVVTRDNLADVALSAITFLPGMIERQRQLVATVTSNEERFRSLVELSSDWYWEQDEQFRFVAGEENELIFPGSVGLRLWEIPGVETTDEHWREHQEHLATRAPFYDFEVKYVAPDGAVRYIVVSGRPIFDKQGALSGYRGVAKDISERRLGEEQIQALAYYDALTSLPNRRLFAQHVERALAQARRESRRLAVMFIDLDRFKNINDALGHEAGDQLLCEISRRLRQCSREGDTISRFGGDEFVLLAEDLNDTDGASVIARKVLAAVARPVTIGNAEHSVTASIGISMYPDDGADQQTLMKHADVAMYAAKGQGKNTFQFYSETTDVHTSDRLMLESDLRKALQNQELVVHYQAKIDLQSRAVTGVEALLRWRHPQLGLLPPDQFIPLAEESGLIVPIGKWVLRVACDQIAEWEKMGVGRFPVAVNLSPRQFYDESLVADVTQILKETGVDPTLLEFEITESMVMHQTDRAVALLTQLKETGIRLAIDDFGTGYSSFSLLKRFPIDTIKIDRSFIHGVPTDAENGVLTSAMIAMGEALHLKIVAEGVEEQAQITFLQKLDCDEVQGFYFSKPVPAEEIVSLLAASGG
jgi:diguanylate cyclase (GGDEF)-like protein/PAS domain S-box-containing protein